MGRVSVVALAVPCGGGGRFRRARGLDRVLLAKLDPAGSIEDNSGKLLASKLKGRCGLGLVNLNGSVGLNSPFNRRSGTGNIVLQQNLLAVVDESNTTVEGSV